MDDRDKLRSLGERLERARAGRDLRRPQSENAEDEGLLRVALGLGMRFGIEMVVALAVGFGIGWTIDRFLGTRPWGMVVFLVLGAAAGIVNVWRALTGKGSAIGYRRSGPPE
jgi:ATP synthase protein I